MSADALLSWAADSRHLAFAYNSDASRMGAYLLDTRAAGGNLLAGSRRLVHAPAPGTNATPWYQIRLTADGARVIAVLAAPNHHNPRGAAQKLEEFSASTGRLLRVLNYLPVGNYTDVEQVLWASPSGHTLLVANTKPYQASAGPSSSSATPACSPATTSRRCRGTPTHSRGLVGPPAPGS